MELIYYEGSKITKQEMEKYRQIIINNSKKHEQASERNKKIIDPIKKGSLIHGVRRATKEILESIIDNGILAPEFIGKLEDGETFYHADFFESHVNGINNWQKYADSKPKLSLFLPNSAIKYLPTIALILNKEWDEKTMVHPGKKEELDKYENKWSINEKGIPLKYNTDIANHVAIFGGVPSSEIQGIIVSKKVDVQEIIDILKIKNFYAPIYNTECKKIY